MAKGPKSRRSKYLCIALISTAVQIRAQTATQSLAERGPIPSTILPATDPDNVLNLTLVQAEQLALRNNPRLSIARLQALAHNQLVRQKRSELLPHISADTTAAEAYTGSRIGASVGLNDSRLFTHLGAQTTVSELITDFGRTSNLVASARLSENAEKADGLATREDIVLLADQAFFGALKARAMLRVAQRSLATRQGTEAQINGLLEAHQRSTLDLGLANGNTVQAQLQLRDAESDVQTAMAALDEVLAIGDDQHYTPQDETHATELPPGDEATLLHLAMRQRPDLLASSLRLQAAKLFAQAEADRMRPTISVIGTVGGEPVRPGQYFVSSWNGAVGANISIPIFDGLLSSAQTKEARLRAQIASEQDRLLRDRIVRDAKTAWLRADNAFQRLRVAGQMLKQANQNLALAQSQYALGKTSYMELSNAELQQADADASNTKAEYLYQMSQADLRYQIGAAP